VIQTRRLRDGRYLAEVDCPHCDSTHWLLNPGHLAYCLTHDNAAMFVDGLGSPVQ
jgi:hypothetical protein